MIGGEEQRIHISKMKFSTKGLTALSASLALGCFADEDVSTSKTFLNSAPRPLEFEAPLQAQSFPLSRLRLLDGPFKQRQDVNARYLFMVEPDRLLAGFRQQAGLP